MKQRIIYLILSLAMVLAIASTAKTAHPIKMRAPIHTATTPPEASITQTTSEAPRNVQEFTPINIPLDAETQQYAYEQSKANGIPVDLTISVIWQESGYRPNLISKTEDYGLMQVNECNLLKVQQELGITNIFDPKQNIKAGTYILGACIRDYPTINQALMVYKEGSTGAPRLWKRGITSIKYTREIDAKRDQINKMIEEVMKE